MSSERRELCVLQYKRALCTHVQDEDRSEEYSFDSLEFELDKVDLEEEEVTTQSNPCKYPETQITVKIDGQKINMKIDSGAEANVISNEMFEQIQQGTGRQINLRSSKAKLKPFNSPAIPVRGVFEAKISTRKKTVIAKVYVTPGSGIRSLMSRYVAFDLGILHISVEELTNTLPNPENRSRKKQVPEVKHLE